jgi:hypothetical protein
MAIMTSFCSVSSTERSPNSAMRRRVDSISDWDKCGRDADQVRQSWGFKRFGQFRRSVVRTIVTRQGEPGEEAGIAAS